MQSSPRMGWGDEHPCLPLRWASMVKRLHCGTGRSIHPSFWSYCINYPIATGLLFDVYRHFRGPSFSGSEHAVLWSMFKIRLLTAPVAGHASDGLIAAMSNQTGCGSSVLSTRPLKFIPARHSWGNRIVSLSGLSLMTDRTQHSGPLFSLCCFNIFINKMYTLPWFQPRHLSSRRFSDLVKEQIIFMVECLAVMYNMSGDHYHD